MSRGALVVSIDVELAWGTWDRPLHRASRRDLAGERAIVDRLLATFERHVIRATWAVVGRLLVPGRHGDDPLWYAPDLVAAIRRARPPQEIASHSFAHICYGAGPETALEVRADLAAARRAHEAAGLPFAAFVFPRNAVGHRDLLAAAGVRAYRGRTPAWWDALPFVRARRLLDLVSFALPTAPPTGRATRDRHGLVDVPASLLLYGRRGLARLVPPAAVAAKARRGLDRAAARGEIFHLWFHPANFARRPDEQFGVLEAVLEHAGRLRLAGRLETRTMLDFCDRFTEIAA